MSEYIVGTTAALLAAAKTAVAGDVIKLNAGTYSGVDLLNLNPAGNVTITSADSANAAVITDMTVRYSSNLSISNVVMQVQPTSTSYFDFRVMDSSNISLSNNIYSGTGMDPVVDSTGLQVRNSSGVSVSDSEFKNLVYGVSFLDSDKISVTNSTFHDIRTDGIRGGGNSQVYFGYNFFTDFHPRTGEHADAIQFWTTNTATSESDITVVGNVYVRGDTGTAVHGIFFRDSLNLPFQNVTVTDNLIIGANYNGMTFEGVESGNVTRNSVIAYTDADSWLRTLNNGTALQISGNTAFKYVTQFDETVDNQTTPAVSDFGLAALQAWSQTRKLPGDFQTWDALASDAGLNWQSPTALKAAAVVTEMYGTAGNDTLAAGASIVAVYGGDGNDSLQGNGVAKLMGQAGDDHYTVDFAGDMVVEDAGQGNDTVLSSIDYVLTDNVENLTLQGAATKGIGNALDNKLTGSANGDTLKGMFGNDVLSGMDGDDFLFGEAGADTLNGGNGHDRLNGGAGADVLTGGAGYDFFVFDGATVAGEVDQVMDFQRGVDKIDLSAIDAIARTTTTNEAFRYIGTKAFSGKAGELQAIAYNKGMLVQGDTNGDKIADFSVMVHNVTKLAASDFVL